jgi:hypothetical protein
VSFEPGELAALDRASKIKLETQAPNGPIHRTTIWTVVDDDAVFIRSVRGEGGRWYREALANPAVSVLVDGLRVPATAIPAGDPDSIDRASDGYRRKYADDPAMGTMIRPEVLPSTLRLEPA